MDATDGIGEIWEIKNDDISQDSQNGEKSKMYNIPADTELYSA
ncbi:13214_t:CDS:2 [Racocetra fulgida]|uniref:13214_t:CDS:1 n=1 Tax=Racocetra fulgida TaxID=60492 RepID=A0A9N8VYU3_9GLOM|nr:13214_t:CDS:2 [Racocetra fulgida]